MQLSSQVWARLELIFEGVKSTSSIAKSALNVISLKRALSANTSRVSLTQVVLDFV